jgi:DNA-binding MarR family transcriptional regulator
MVYHNNDRVRYTNSIMMMNTPQKCMPPELVKSMVFLLGRLGMTVKKQAVEELEAAGYSPYDYGVLTLVADGQCGTQGTIADALGLDRGQLVGLLDGLEERGLIERKRDPNDRRRHTVLLTTDGKRQLSRLRSIVKRIEDEFFAPLAPHEREQLHELLVTVARYHDPRFESPAKVAVAS